MWGLSALMRHTPDSLCQLETPVEEDVFALSDDSLLSVIEVQGALRLLDGHAISGVANQFAEQFSATMSRKGHFMLMVFHRDPFQGRIQVREKLAPSRLTADRIRLDLGDYFDSQEEALSRLIAYESVWIVVGSQKTLLNPAELKQDKKRSRMAPHGNGSIDVTAGSGFLASRHRAFVRSVTSVLNSRDILSRVLTVSEIVRTNRIQVDPEWTGEEWKPRLPGGRFPLRFPTPAQTSHDFSHLLWPSVGRQIFPRDAYHRSLRTVEIGEWLHAPVAISLPPENPSPFIRLFNTILPSKIPWRASFLWTGDGLSTMGMKRFLADFLSWTPGADDNKMISDSLKILKADQDQAKIGWQAMVDTWAPKNDPSLLSRRASTLVQAVQGWGNCDTTEQTGDPLLGVVSTLPGFAPTRSPAPKAAAPIYDACFMAPFFRPCLPWQDGAWLLRTPDGKLTPYQPGSSLQPAWVEIGGGPMGYGKSNALAMANLALALSPGRDTLPFVMTVDRGPSSAGLVNLLKARLPDKPEYQRLVAFHRLQNTREYAMNPLDTPLGCRTPLPLHRSFLQNLFTILATPMSGEVLDGVPGLMQMAIDRTFMDMAPYEEKGTRPRLYEEGLMTEIDQAIKTYGVPTDTKTTWWNLEDHFFGIGKIMEAMLCHRRAVPTIADVAATIQDPSIQNMYREGTTKDVQNLPMFAWRSLIDAINAYPILSEPTKFDIGDARVVALDLDEVTTGTGPVADRQNVIMYMMARHVLGSRLFLMPDHVPMIHPLYQEYHAARIAQIRSDPKKLSFDEFHKVSTNPVLVQQFQRDLETTIRESRKWNLHIGLYSQRIEDFPDSLLDHATTIMVFGVANEDEAIRTAEKLHLDPPLARALSRIMKPTAEGANMVAAFRTDRGFVQQLLTNTLGQVALWSFSTVAEDKAVRDALQAVLGVREAIRRLVLRYPGGVKTEVERRRMSRGLDEDGDVIREIVDELIRIDPAA